MEQISEKLQKIEKRIKINHNKRKNEFISKRQEKFNKIRDELEKNNENIDRRNNKLMKKYFSHMKFISKKNRSMYIKKENLKYLYNIYF
jgi:hypothetical protein